MKTAISIPDDLFKQAERYARKTKVSRSKLYANALRIYLRRQGREQLTEEANRLADQADTSLTAPQRRAVNQMLRYVEW